MRRLVELNSSINIKIMNSNSKNIEINILCFLSLFRPSSEVVTSQPSVTSPLCISHLPWWTVWKIVVSDRLPPPGGDKCKALISLIRQGSRQEVE